MVEIVRLGAKARQNQGELERNGEEEESLCRWGCCRRKRRRGARGRRQRRPAHGGAPAGLSRRRQRQTGPDNAGRYCCRRGCEARSCETCRTLELRLAAVESSGSGDAEAGRQALAECQVTAAGLRAQLAEENGLWRRRLAAAEHALERERAERAEADRAAELSREGLRELSAALADAETAAAAAAALEQGTRSECERLRALVLEQTAQVEALRPLEEEVVSCRAALAGNAALVTRLIAETSSLADALNRATSRAAEMQGAPQPQPRAAGDESGGGPLLQDPRIAAAETAPPPEQDIASPPLPPSAPPTAPAPRRQRVGLLGFILVRKLLTGVP